MNSTMLVRAKVVEVLTGGRILAETQDGTKVTLWKNGCRKIKVGEKGPFLSGNQYNGIKPKKGSEVVFIPKSSNGAMIEVEAWGHDVCYKRELHHYVRNHGGKVQDVAPVLEKVTPALLKAAFDSAKPSPNIPRQRIPMSEDEQLFALAASAGGRNVGGAREF